MLNNVNLKWVAAQLKPNMLNKVENHLRNQCYDFFAPKRQETIRTTQIFKKIYRLLFPGYIFIRIDPNSKDVISLNSTFGISRLVRRGDGKVAILPDEFISNLMDLHNKNIICEKSDFKKGKKILWIDGPFSGKIGEILKLDQNGRLKILFQILEESRIITTNHSKVQLI